MAAMLAGGEGRRLGGLPKEGILLEGEALGLRLAKALRRSFRDIIVITKNERLYEGTGALVSPDLRPGFGPLSGLHAALSQARDLHDRRATKALADREGPPDDAKPWIWLAACDMPRFDPRLVDILASELVETGPSAEGSSATRPLACVTSFGGHFEPFQALYSIELLPTLEALFAEAAEASTSQERKSRPGHGPRRPSFKDLFALVPVAYVAEERVRAISPDWELFFNINTPEDLGRLA